MTKQRTSPAKRHFLGAVALWLGVCLAAAAQSEPEFAQLRQQMVREQIIRRGVRDERVLRVMGELPRHLFVPPNVREQSYADKALPKEVAEKIQASQLAAVQKPASGKLLGNWKAGEKIAQALLSIGLKHWA